MGLSDFVKVMTTTWSGLVIQCSNWTTNNDLSQEANNYGVFDAYVILYNGQIMDQRLQAYEVPHFLTHLGTYHDCCHVLVQGQQELNSLEVEDPAQHDDAIWMVSGINAYTRGSRPYFATI